MKKVLSLVLALTMLLALCACGSKGSTSANSGSGDKKVETIELSCSVGVPEDNPLGVAMKKMGEDLYKRTDGRYTIKVYANGTLCSQSELFGMLKSGGVIMGEAPLDAQAEADIRFSSHQLPFAFESMEANLRFNKLINERLNNKILEEKFGVFPLFTLTSGLVEYISNGKRVEKVDDLKGQLIWVTNSLASATVTALGASPVTLDWNDGLPGLQKHTIDSCFSTSLFGPTLLQWYEDGMTDVTMCNLCGTASNMFMSLEVFNKMSEADQKILLELAAVAEKEIMDYYYDYLNKAPEFLTEKGVSIYEVPADELSSWRDAAASVYDDYYAKLDPADAEIIRQTIIDANAG